MGNALNSLPARGNCEGEGVGADHREGRNYIEGLQDQPGWSEISCMCSDSHMQVCGMHQKLQPGDAVALDSQK